MDAIALADTVAEKGASKLVLLGPIDDPSKPPGILYLGSYSPIQRNAIDVVELVQKLSPNLTGSLSLQDYIEALRLFYPGNFRVYACNTARGRLALAECRRLVEDWLQDLCRAEAKQDPE